MKFSDSSLFFSGTKSLQFFPVFHLPDQVFFLLSFFLLWRQFSYQLDSTVFVLQKSEINNVGVLESYSTNPKTTTEASETMGNDILLASYHFRVIHSTDFTTQIVTNVIDLTAVTMTDVSLIDFVINTRSSVVDYQVRKIILFIILFQILHKHQI